MRRRSRDAGLITSDERSFERKAGMPETDEFERNRNRFSRLEAHTARS